MKRLAIIEVVGNASYVTDSVTVRCDECKHWGTKAEAAGAHVCTRMMHFGEYEVPTDTTYMRGAMFTAADFGCARFEKPEEAS